VEGVVDSNFAGDLDKGMFTTGYAFTYGGSPVSLKSTFYCTVALSTIEAEYMEVVEAAKEALWLKGLVKSLGRDQGVVSIHCDSLSAIHLARDQVFHSRTKHISIKCHKI